MIQKKDFTHYASFYSIPCYWNQNTQQLSGRNLAFDWLLLAATSLHNYLIAPFQDEPGFPIYLGDEIEK